MVVVLVRRRYTRSVTMNAPTRPHPLLVHSAMSLTMLLWGGSFVASKFVLGIITPMTYMGVRFGIAALVLVPIALYRGLPRFGRRTHLLIALTAFSEPVAYFLFESYGLRLVSATTASLVIATVPLAVMVLAALALGEPIHRRGLIAVAVSLAGIALLVVGGRDSVAVAAGTVDFGERVIGILLIFGAVISAAGYITLARSLTQRHDSVRITVLQTWWGTAAFSLLWLSQPAPARSVEGLGRTGWAAILFLAVGATVMAFLLYNWALRHETAGRASLYINAIPVVTAVAGWFLLGESLTGVQWIGAACVVGSVRLAIGSPARVTPPLPPVVESEP